MEFSVHRLQDVKLGVHIAQIIFSFVSWCLCITVFRSTATVDGRFGWYFGLCFLMLPAIIYLTMTPRFPRTRKLAHPYALAAVDGLFTLFWLSAFAAVANWNSTGDCKSGCSESKAVVGLGVFIWFFWIATTAISVYGIIYWRSNGYLPGASRMANNGGGGATIDPDKEAFSTAPHDEYAPIHTMDHEEAGNGLGYNGESSEQPRYDANAPAYSGGGIYMPPQVHDENTAYSGYGGQETPKRAQFPAGNYD